MNIDPSSSGLDTSSQMITWSDDFLQSFAQTKSYRCTFCKRGFSNAQALGGHMNIHRKDRAKLKEFSSESLLSLDIMKTSDCEDSPLDKSSASELENQTKKQCSGDDESDDLQIMEENLMEGLPLFAEAPSVKSGDGEVEEGGSGTFDKRVEDRSRVGFGYGELDLELRLGPEPHDAKSKPKSEN